MGRGTGRGTLRPRLRAGADRPIPMTLEVQRHGGVHEADLAETGLRPADVLDFSTSLNPLGPPPAVRRALAELDPSRYPDPACTALRRALAERLSVDAAQILVGNGSTELIHLAVRLFVRRGQRPIVLAPTFSEFERAVEAAGGHVYPWTATAQRGFRWALRNKPAVLERVRPPLVWLCNPNNPTGVYLGREQVQQLAFGLTDGPLLLDEAYVSFVENPWSSLELATGGRAIVLRSMTKDYAIPGLRLGYMVAHADVVAAAAALQPEWSVNAAAQAAGLAALAVDGYLDEGRRVAAEAKAYLTRALGALGYEINAGAANFILVRVGDAGAARRALLQRGIAVRDCTSFGLPQFIRLGMRRLDDCRRLVEAMAALHAEA
jgi:histidinol-phosphate aminotransferase